MPRRLLLALVVLATGWLALWLGLDLFVDFWAYQVLFGGLFAAYIWALALALRVEQPGRGCQVVLVLVPALVFRLLLLPADLAFSDDIFRYIWDGRVNAAGIDPYAYAPGDPALAPLRDDRIWPLVNAKDQPSPYPPLLEAWFATVYWFWPESLVAMKAAMIALDMAVIGLLLLLLQLRGQPLLRAAIYAWSPQVVFQVGFSGHNEPLLLFWILAALVLGQRLPERRAQNAERQAPGFWFVARLGVLETRRLFGAFALALATLAKLVPVLVLPILLRRWGWRPTGVYLATLATVYGSLLLRGQQLFGGIAIETTVSQFNDGLYYPVYKIAEVLNPGDPHSLAQFSVRAVLLAIIIWLALRPGDDLAQPLGIVLAAYILLAASVAPWYVLWVLPFVSIDALPSPLGRRPYRERLFGGYWLPFSWTAAFSELYYLGLRPVWVVAHILVYAIPAANLGFSWLHLQVRELMRVAEKLKRQRLYEQAVDALEHERRL